MTLPWAGRLFQIGYVVPDLEAAMRYFHDNLGVAKFMVRQNTHLADQCYRGERSDFRQSIAFCYTGTMQIELIQPITGPSTYTEFIEQHPNGGVQHLGYQVDDLAAATDIILANGYNIVQSGMAGTTRLAYFETSGMPTTLIELLEIDPREIETFERLQRGEVGIAPGEPMPMAGSH